MNDQELPVLVDIEFYTTPDGEVTVKPVNGAAYVLKDSHREIIEPMLAMIREMYPEAYSALMELYSKSSMNRWWYEYRVVHRFIRCNFGEYDQHRIDIDQHGHFCFEEVRCPLRGECQFEGVICKPRFDSKLSDRELEVVRLIVLERMDARDIAAELHISPLTVNRHRENAKIKTGCRTVAQLVDWWHRSGVSEDHN